MKYAILAALGAHFVGDFVCQTDWQARNKSTNWRALVSHVACYTGVLLVWMQVVQPGKPMLWYGLLNGAIHLGVDAVTSRINKRLWAAGNMHNFFVGVGADQLVHGLTLILTLPISNFI